MRQLENTSEFVFANEFNVCCFNSVFIAPLGAFRWWRPTVLRYRFACVLGGIYYDWLDICSLRVWLRCVHSSQRAEKKIGALPRQVLGRVKILWACSQGKWGSQTSSCQSWCGKVSFGAKSEMRKESQNISKITFWDSSAIDSFPYSKAIFDGKFLMIKSFDFEKIE